MCKKNNVARNEWSDFKICMGSSLLLLVKCQVIWNCFTILLRKITNLGIFKNKSEYKLPLILSVMFKNIKSLHKRKKLPNHFKLFILWIFYLTNIIMYIFTIFKWWFFTYWSVIYLLILFYFTDLCNLHKLISVWREHNIMISSFSYFWSDPMSFQISQVILHFHK